MTPQAEDIGVPGVVVMDGNDLAVLGLGAAIRQDPRLRWAGSGRTLAAGLDAIRREAPAVVVLDVNLRDVRGLPDCGELFAVEEALRVVLYAETPTADLARWADEEGVSMLVSKTTDVAAVLDAIADPERRLAAPPLVDHFLQPQELRVLALMVADADVREIAQRLGMTTAEVNGCVEDVVVKLGASNAVGAVMAAVHHGLVPR